jgi:DNA-directed RNA polymerase beta' subunit
MSMPLAAKKTISGPEAIEYLLSRVDPEQMQKEQTEVVRGGKVSKRGKAVKILNILEGMKRNNLKPMDFLIRQVPVIPPAFRPFTVAGSTFVPGDANELYRDLFDYKDVYNESMQVLGSENSQDARLGLYDAVKALYGYAESPSFKTKSRGVAGFLKMITSKGSPKFSFIQRKLLSKTQDTVGRGVIIVDPDLSMDEIGIPEQIAWKSYAPYVQRRLVRAGMTPADALKNVLDKTDMARKALEKELPNRPVIYSRAPAWHKFNIVAGKPKLIDGDAIAINPYVTAGQNADFDGDTVNVHVPSADEAVQEAFDKLMPSKMLFSIKDQDRVVPSIKHEQVLGIFTAKHRPAKNKHFFPSEALALSAIEKGQISLTDDVDYPGAPP